MYLARRVFIHLFWGKSPQLPLHHNYASLPRWCIYSGVGRLAMFYVCRRACQSTRIIKTLNYYICEQVGEQEYYNIIMYSSVARNKSRLESVCVCVCVRQRQIITYIIYYMTHYTVLCRCLPTCCWQCRYQVTTNKFYIDKYQDIVGNITSSL